MRRSGERNVRFSNDTIGHRQLVKWVKQLRAAVQVICESSGGYERGLVRALVGGRVKISLVQANRVRQFARAAGILAKTDCIDAQVLCEFGKVMRPPMVTAATLEQEHLRELESQRRHLTHLLVMGAKSRCTGERRLRARIKSQSDKPDQEADRGRRQAEMAACGCFS
jgi:transposase